MRATEFISEATSKAHDEHISTMATSMVLHDMDPGYDFYRFMSIVAGDHDNDMLPQHEHFKAVPFVVAYTKHEEDMLIRGLKRMGKKHKFVAKDPSEEPGTTNTKSPMVTAKKNRYGV